MLVLTRKLHESIVIDGNISVTLVAIRGNQVRIGISAPKSVGVYRSELREKATAGKSVNGHAPSESEHALLSSTHARFAR
jgi:carbon storage regulator